MNYLKSLFFNFLIVFFANHLLPGIDVVMQKKLPDVGGDLLFAIGLGLLNSLICPVLKLINKRSSVILQLVLTILVLNFTAYALLKLLPFGIRISTWEGYFFPAMIVSIVSFVTNFLEIRRHHRHHHSEELPPSDEPPTQL